MRKRKVIIDALLNIIATALPILILQLIILPIIGVKLGDEQYGLVITLISLSTLLSLPLGNVLNNVRLLTNNDYEKDNMIGDFNILLLGAVTINAIMIFFGTFYYEGDFLFISIVLMVILSCFNLVREYLIVSFRITLNYKAILVNNIILAMGYLLGLSVFYITGYWQLIYIVGSALSLVYILRHTDLLKEKLIRTSFFKKTTYKTFILFISSFMKTILNYADKLLIFPLLGPAAVSIYYTATILGKIITLAISPISAVMLSYLTKMEKMKLQHFLSVIFFSLIFGVIGYFFTVLISSPVLHFLYPSWAKESMKLIPITTATAIMEMMSSAIHPIVLRFNNINWQFVISVMNLMVYMVGIYIFYQIYGLIGFAIGVLIASIFKFLLSIAVYLFNYSKNEDMKVSTGA